jgi:hypothetical protein
LRHLRPRYPPNSHTERKKRDHEHHEDESFGVNGNCKGEDWAYRADIDDTQNFVLDFLD